MPYWHCFSCFGSVRLSGVHALPGAGLDGQLVDQLKCLACIHQACPQQHQVEIAVFRAGRCTLRHEQVSNYDAKTRLSQLGDLAAAGEDVVVATQVRS